MILNRVPSPCVAASCNGRALQYAPVGNAACPRCGIAIFSAHRAENCTASLKTPRFFCHRQRFGVFPDDAKRHTKYGPPRQRRGINPHPALRATFPQGKAFCGAPCMTFHAQNRKCAVGAGVLDGPFCDVPCAETRMLSLRGGRSPTWQSVLLWFDARGIRIATPVKSFTGSQ